MKIALAQCDIAFEQPGVNLKHFAELATRAAEAGAELIVFPEMSATGYSLRPEKVAEAQDGPIYRNFRALARQCSIAVGFGLAVSRGGRFFNSFFVLDRFGDEVYAYDKVHPFSFSGEDRLYRAGSELAGFRLSPDGPRLCGVVCYDLRFPELFTAAAPGTDLFLVIANWPRERSEHWKLLLRARALDSLAYVAGVNRVGTGGKLEYAGDSGVYDPWGQPVAAAGNAPELLLATVDPERPRAIRNEFSLLEDRREFRFRTPP